MREEWRGGIEREIQDPAGRRKTTDKTGNEDLGNVQGNMKSVRVFLLSIFSCI